VGLFTFLFGKRVSKRLGTSQERAPHKLIRTRHGPGTDEIAAIQTLRDEGMSLRAIATELDIPLATVARYAKRRDELADELSEFAETAEKFEGMQRVLKRFGARIGAGSGWRDMLAESVSNAIPQVSLGVNAALMGLGIKFGLPPEVVASLVRPHAAPAAAVSPVSPPSVVPAPRAGAVPEQAKSPALTFFLDNLQDKTPEEAAEWFASWAAQRKDAAQFVATLVSTRDDDLPRLVDSIAAVNPALASFAAWLRERPEWFLAAVRRLRVLHTSTGI
jgi:AcrR family transcriptional regulator